MPGLPVSRRNTVKAAKRLVSTFRNRWWIWGGIMASVVLMLLGNFLVIKASLSSFELAKTKGKARSITHGDVEAAIANVILRSENYSDTVMNTTVEADDQVATTSSTDLGTASAVATRSPRTIYRAMQGDVDIVIPSEKTTTQTSTEISFGQATTIRAEESNDAPTVKAVGVPIVTSESGRKNLFMATNESRTTSPPTTTNGLQNEVFEDKEVPGLSSVSSRSPKQMLLDKCFNLQDYGLPEALRSSSNSFCTTGSNGSPYTLYHVPDTEFRATQLKHFMLDMRGAQVSRDINSVAQDGGAHDPRFRYKPNAVFCSCDDPQDAPHKAPDIWMQLLADTPTSNYVVCQPFSSDVRDDTLILNRAVILTRKDDHNPFFQISGILNAWIMIKVLGWESSSTQLVTLDRALPSPVDDLRHAMLAPNRVVIGGDELQKRVLHLESALLAPYEARGPMMSHLNDVQPCYANEMIKDFRDEALKNMNVAPQKTDPKRCLITIISRRPYGGRTVQRVWQNEGEILHGLRVEYKDVYRFGECEFQSLDFVNMTMRDQMQVMVDSDIVIGMHGAGMVNVMWTRPETLVIEIFPRQRWRWGYRNLCQYLGCAWREFRGGQDMFVRTTDPNDMDKRVRYDEWKRFFDPLFRAAIAKLEQKIEAA